MAVGFVERSEILIKFCHVGPRISLIWCVSWNLSRNHYSDFIFSAITPQITGVSLFIQTYVQMQIKENIKAPRRGLLWEIHHDRWIPCTKGQ